MKQYLRQVLTDVLSNMDGVPADFSPEFQTPGNPEHGDVACNAAMQLARHLKKAPRAIAQDIVDALNAFPVDSNRISDIEIAGPGFLNFRFSNNYLYTSLADLRSAGGNYGRTKSGEGKTALVEYVSANPTGPLTVGHGRNAVLGDTVANLLEWTGHKVTREYYFNDAGRQMRVLGQSVQARYRELIEPAFETRKMDLGEGEFVSVPVFFPEGGYLGDYIYDIARDLIEKHSDALLTEEDETIFKEAAESAIFKIIEDTLLRMDIKMDNFFNERTVYENNAVWDTVEALREKGMVYESEGAVWYKTTELGKDKDTVLVKSSGEPTYRLPDIAYHIDKLNRGFDKVIDVLGADHIATFPDVISALNLLGYDADKVSVVIYQFVTLVRSGKPVKMSTRKANFVTLDELMDDVSSDVTRFFFLMRSSGSHLEFDLDLAKEASDKNPVFYLQYAHARIHSILRKANEQNLVIPDELDLTVLTHPAEITLIKELLLFPERIANAANASEPQRLITYMREVASAFSQFYSKCYILGEAEEIATARLALADATRLVLKNGLTVLGLSSPEKM